MNGNILLYGVITIIKGSIIAAAVFTFAFITLNNDGNNGNNN